MPPTPGPWEYVPSTEHHGPYVRAPFGGKFAIGVGAQMSQAEQSELERMQMSGEVRLLDVTPIAAEPGLYRIFILHQHRKDTP